jgi:hypothetical protein
MEIDSVTEEKIYNVIRDLSYILYFIIIGSSEQCFPLASLVKILFGFLNYIIRAACPDIILDSSILILYDNTLSS